MYRLRVVSIVLTRLTGQFINRDFHLVFMPEKGWYSLTVRLSTARMIRELALAKELTVDELLNRLLLIQSNEWLTCSLCGVKVRATNMSGHMAKMHPR